MARGDERLVVEAFAAWLVSQNWAVRFEENWWDILAVRRGQRLFVEAKGLTTSPGLDVDTAFGQILRRMPAEGSVQNELACRLCLWHWMFQDHGVLEEVLTDELWIRLKPLIPAHPRRFRYPGRKRACDRAALEGILYVVRTGIGWNRLPTALFGASGATCWRRLIEWYEAGVWQQLHERLLSELRTAGLLDLSAALVDSTHLRALKGGTTRARARSIGASSAPSTT